jgi:hypothetical protein
MDVSTESALQAEWFSRLTPEMRKLIIDGVVGVEDVAVVVNNGKGGSRLYNFPQSKKRS